MIQVPPGLRGKGVVCSLLEPEQSTEMGLSGSKCLLAGWLGRAGDPSSILSVKQRRYARHPLMHMGNTKVKYSTTFYRTKLCLLQR